MALVIVTFGRSLPPLGETSGRSCEPSGVNACLASPQGRTPGPADKTGNDIQPEVDCEVGGRENGHVKVYGLWVIAMLDTPRRRFDGVKGTPALARDPPLFPALPTFTGLP